MKRARDVRDQLVGLMERVEIELTSSDDTQLIRKAITAGVYIIRVYHTMSTGRICISKYLQKILNAENIPWIYHNEYWT